MNKNQLPRLKSLVLQGYKTFANRTPFEFANTITAIVGPNGSGKSNITDSIRWVLGEQSFSLLRAKKSEDMIFSGSEARTRLGMASATITFDNSDGWLPIDFSEVAITRRAFRDGQNEYRINGQRVRLRDVAELLAQSGLAERTYTIIGQGLVDVALSLRADERRRLFEEAAGIGLYRSRREEALRRLEITHRNLDRVQDILAEIKPRLQSLERQARRAAEYEQIRLDLQVLLREWYGYHWRHSQMKLKNSQDFAQKQEQKLEVAQQSLREKESETEKLRQHLQTLRANLNSWHSELSGLHSERELVIRKLAVTEERMRSSTYQENAARNELVNLTEQIGFYQEQIEGLSGEIQRIEGDLREARKQFEEAQSALARRQKEKEELEVELQAQQDLLGDLRSQQAKINVRISERKSQLEHNRQMLTSAENKLLEWKREQDSAHDILTNRKKELDQTQQNYGIASKSIEDHRAAIGGTESEHKRITDQHSGVLTELAGVQTQINVLEQAEQTLNGYGKGTQILIKASREQRLKNAKGALSNYLEVPQEYEKAISSALGEFLEAVLLKDDPFEALNLLEEKAGRAALIPLHAIRHSHESLELEKTPQVIGIAADFVQVDQEYQAVIDLLLGQVVIVSNRSAARQVLKGKPASFRAVTLKGEVFFASGPVLTSGEGSRSVSQTLLGRVRNRRELQNKQQELQHEEENLQGRLKRIQAQREVLQKKERELIADRDESRKRLEQAQVDVSHAEAHLRSLEKQLDWHKEQQAHIQSEIQDAEQQLSILSEEQKELEQKLVKVQKDFEQKRIAFINFTLNEIQSQVTHWRTILAVSESTLADVQNRQTEKSSELQNLEERQQSLQNQLENLQKELQDHQQELKKSKQDQSQLRTKIEQIQERIEPVEKELNTTEQSQFAYQKSEATVRQSVSSAEHLYAQARISLAKHQEALETLRHRIEDDFGLVAFEYVDQISGPKPLPLDGMVEELPFISELSPGIEETIKRQRAQLKRMGAINPEAQTEYQEVTDRHQFLTSQLADLQAAEGDVLQVINELEGLMEREFLRTFVSVAEVFQDIFVRLFGGGSARLTLTQPDDLTSSGVDIEARLPGRRAQGLALLSGGERSLTAAALIFSLMKISPTPFCVLDEVDAMLDEVNIGRFRELLRELSEKTQFIIVTHNRNTVQVADIIYGVTMGRDSVSQVLSLKLDQVSEVVKE